VAKLDSEQERKRLSAVYSAMFDAELQKLAQDRESLTEPAREVLPQEFARRNLPQPDAADQGFDEIEQRELVTIGKFRDLPEALLVKGRLDSAGIESFLVDDNMVRLDWFISNLLGGIKVQVAKDDAANAEELLSQPIPEDFDVEGVGEYVQPRCPKCQSLDISFQELQKLISYGSAYVGVPVPVNLPGWKCHSCNYEWQDDPNAESATAG
jgi:hypothetical protein